MNTPKGLFVGICTSDYLYYIDEYPSENTKVKTNHFANYVGGPATNAAITYAMLGGNATLATCLGDSAEADAMIRNITSYGVKVLNFSRDKILPNTASIVVSGNGNRTIFSGQNIFKEIEFTDVKDYDFYLFDCNQQEIALTILKEIPKDKKVVLDAGSWKENMDCFLHRANIVIASEVFQDENGNDIFHINDCHADAKVMTRGEKPLIFNEREIPVPKVEVVDTLGAGDIFHGAFCYGYFVLNKSKEDALKYAVTIASESVKHKGPRIL
ncbi:MAG: hypothetical protein J6A75_01280 [Lachnospiraceae bacterium]|nr:hypothetical protein [Lachnospiraceae bacterium]